MSTPNQQIFSKNLLVDKVCLITGGSRGGMLKDIAQQFVIHGAKAVILMCRSKEKSEMVVKDINEVAKK